MAGRGFLRTGIQSEETVKKLLSEKQLTLQKVVSICRANENASKDTENLQAVASGISRISNFNKQSSKQYQSSSQYKSPPWEKRNLQKRMCNHCGEAWHERLSQCPVWQENEKQSSKQYQKSEKNYKYNGQQKFQRRQCRRCGKEWHNQLSECPARDKNCGQWGEQGHFARYCMNEVAGEEEYDSGNTWRITVAGVNKVSYRKKTPKVIITATHDEETVKLEATPDTGAEMSVIGVEEATRLDANVNNLKLSKHRLYAADRKLPHIVLMLLKLLTTLF